MSLDDRFTLFLLGIVIGFFLGYVTRTLREIKEETHEVNEIVKGTLRKEKDEGGWISGQTAKNLVLLFVVLITAFSAFRSQQASNEVKETQEKYSKVVSCNKQVLSEALDVLNSRTSYTQSAASAILQLQKSQALLFGVLLHIPPYSQERQDQAKRLYVQDLNDYIEAGTKSEANAKINKYPEAEDLTDCIEEDTGE